jgi:hypothetical protein
MSSRETTLADLAPVRRPGSRPGAVAALGRALALAFARGGVAAAQAQSNPLERADPLASGDRVRVPERDEDIEPRDVDNPGVAVDLLGVAAPDAERMTSARTWYDASSSLGGTAGLPIVEQPGQLARQVPRERQPWSGPYWATIRCALAFPGASGYLKPHGLAPLEAYDTYVYNTRGENPQAALWEARAETLGADPRTGWFFHDLGPLWLFGPDTSADPDPRVEKQAEYGWYGHCNAWTAASILVPEPPIQVRVTLPRPLKLVHLKKRKASLWTRKDNEAGAGAYVVEDGYVPALTLTRADIAGVLTEACMGTSTRSFGDATRLPQTGHDTATGRPDSDRPGSWVGLQTDVAGGLEELSEDERRRWRDPAPHNFHLTMLAMIVDRQMPLAGDIDADRYVDNHPIFGYAYKRNYKTERGKRFYEFHARTRLANYRGDPSLAGTDAADVDAWFRVYLDRDNRISSSEWIGPSGNPANTKAHWDNLWFPASFRAGTGQGNRNLDDAIVREIVARYARQ